METKKIYTATEARKNFFDILNRVLYGNERMFIKKYKSIAIMSEKSVSKIRIILCWIKIGGFKIKNKIVLLS